MNSRDFLYQIYTERKSRNANYSIRAFARDLSIPSGRLTEIFNGKRHLTEKLGERICQKIRMEDERAQRFLEIIRGEKQSKRKVLHRQQIDLEVFEKVFSPEAFAVLSLMETRSFKSDVAYIAKRLHLAPEMVVDILQRLTEMGFITTNSLGQYKPTYASTTTVSNAPSESIRNYHKKILQLVVEKIDETDVAERDVSSMTLAINRARLPEAKRKITKFRRSLCKYLETGKKTDVYYLNVQLFPLTKKD